MRDKQDSGFWFLSFSHWGELFIERSCTNNDPQWRGTYLNGVPTIQFMDGLYDFQLAKDLVDYLNQVYDDK